jgi:hypothetical protein
VLGARDLDAMGCELGIEIAAVGEAAVDARLAGFVDHLVEHVAGRRREAGDRRGEHRVRLARSFDGHAGLAHPHRLAGQNLDQQHALAAGRRRDADFRREEAVGLERAARLAFALEQQVVQALLAQFAPELRFQRQAPAHVRLLFRRQATDIDARDGVGRGRQRGAGDRCGQEYRKNPHGRRINRRPCDP